MRSSSSSRQAEGALEVRWSRKRRSEADGTWAELPPEPWSQLWAELDTHHLKLYARKPDDEETADNDVLMALSLRNVRAIWSKPGTSRRFFMSTSRGAHERLHVRLKTSQLAQAWRTMLARAVTVACGVANVRRKAGRNGVTVVVRHPLQASSVPSPPPPPTIAPPPPPASSSMSPRASSPTTMQYRLARSVDVLLAVLGSRGLELIKHGRNGRPRRRVVSATRNAASSFPSASSSSSSSSMPVGAAVAAAAAAAAGRGRGRERARSPVTSGWLLSFAPRGSAPAGGGGGFGSSGGATMLGLMGLMGSMSISRGASLSTAKTKTLHVDEISAIGVGLSTPILQKSLRRCGGTTEVRAARTARTVSLIGPFFGSRASIDLEVPFGHPGQARNEAEAAHLCHFLACALCHLVRRERASALAQRAASAGVSPPRLGARGEASLCELRGMELRDCVPAGQAIAERILASRSTGSRTTALTRRFLAAGDQLIASEDASNAANRATSSSSSSRGGGRARQSAAATTVRNRETPTPPLAAGSAGTTTTTTMAPPAPLPAAVPAGRMCVVCLSTPKDTACSPCGHMCLCAACAEELESKALRDAVRQRGSIASAGQYRRCPVCRRGVERWLRIFDS